MAAVEDEQPSSSSSTFRCVNLMKIDSILMLFIQALMSIEYAQRTVRFCTFTSLQSAGHFNIFIKLPLTCSNPFV